MPSKQTSIPKTLTVTALALTSSLAINAQAEDRQPQAKQPASMEDMFDAMVSDSSVDLGLRNFYFNRDFHNQRLVKKGKNKDKKLPSLAESWTQGARLEFNSGYFDDIIGLNASWYGALKLVGDEEKFGAGALRELSPKAKNNHLVAKQESYDKLGQIYLKARCGDEDLNSHVKVGRMFLDTPLLNDSDSRTTPSTTQAVFAEVNYENLGIYGIYSDQASGKTESGFHKYENDNGKTWDVNILGASVNLDNGIDLNLATGQAKGYLKQNYLNASYNLDLGNKTNLLLDGYYQTEKDDGKKYGSSLDSKLWNTAARITVDTLSFMLSYQKVNGDSYVSSWGGSDDSGLYTWNSVQYSDFNQKNEKSWQGRVDYSFSNLGIPGLSVMTRYVKGDYKNSDKSKANEWERDTDIKYAFQQGNLSGLSITYRNATVRGTDKSSVIDENRLIIGYTIPII